MWEMIGLILKLLPMVFEIIKMIQHHRLTTEATAEMISDLEQTAQWLSARAGKARATVDTSQEAIDNDPNNMD